jgi:alkyldihydroxyacetonephosphate synthase
MERRRKFWGWGYEGEGPDDAQAVGIARVLGERFGIRELDVAPAPRIEDLSLRAPRLDPPANLAEFCSTSPFDRASHTHGKSYRDIVRGARREFTHPPDFVAFPRSEDEVVAMLDWCSGAGAAAIPYGGGSSVVGGIEPDVSDAYRGAVSVDLGRLDRVLEIDRESRAARIQAGILGPALEDALRPQGLTLRHFPQSFELSTLGGWIATRSGGHYATLYTHIDDFVEALRIVTSSCRRSAAGSPLAPAGTTPPSTRTSTISSKPCGS